MEDAARVADSADVIIIGGGISGLTAAYDLARAGRRVRLVEARTRVGGLVFTEHVDGITIEAGPDALLMQKPAAAALCAELGLPLVPTRAPRTAYVLRDEELIPLPSPAVLGIPITAQAIAASTMLSAEGRARLARELEMPAPPTHDDDVSVGEFVRRRFGDEAVRYIAQPLLGGIHSGDVERLSLRALFPLLAAVDRAPGSVIATLAARRPDGAGDPDGVFRSIATGLGDLIAALVQRLPADTIRAGASVVRIVPPSRSVPALSAPGSPSDARRSSTPPAATPPDAAPSAAAPRAGAPPSSSPPTPTSFTVALSTGETLRAPALVLAVPAYAVADLIAPIDAPLADRCREIPYASSVSITLGYRRDTVGRALVGNGFVVPRGERRTRLLAVSFVTSKWEGRAPDDVVVLRAFVGGTLDEDLLDRDDRDLLRLAHGDLAPLLGLDAPPFFERLYRWDRVGPQYEVGHLDRLAAIEQRAAAHPGLFLTGSAFRGVGIPDNVADARRIAVEVGRWLDARSTAKMSV